MMPVDFTSKRNLFNRSIVQDHSRLHPSFIYAFIQCNVHMHNDISHSQPPALNGTFLSFSQVERDTNADTKNQVSVRPKQELRTLLFSQFVFNSVILITLIINSIIHNCHMPLHYQMLLCTNTGKFAMEASTTSAPPS